MSTFIFTLSVTLSADNIDDAWDDFNAWMTSPSNVENGVDVTEIQDDEVEQFTLVDYDPPKRGE